MNDMSIGLARLPEPVIIKERLTRQILRSVMAQFSSLSEALLELADNAYVFETGRIVLEEWELTNFNVG